MTERKYLRIFLLLPAVLVLYFIFQIFRPFLVPIILAATLVSLCYPVFNWIRSRLRHRDNLAALITCVAIALIIMIPFVLLIPTLSRQVGQVYQSYEAALEQGAFQDLGLHSVPYLGFLVDWLKQYVDLERVDFAESMASTLREASLFLLRQSSALLSGAAHFVVNFFIMLITMFFLLRDGSRLAAQFRAATPLTQQYEELLSATFREVARATILGNLLTSLAQGTAGALVFWLLGVPNVVFWGALMALFSLVPVIGTAIVWVPWVIYFLLTGAYWSALILLLLSVFFVGMIDNILRPLFIEGQSGMHTLLVFFSIMGGISYFGMVGLIFGPITVAVGLTFLELFKTEFKEMLSKPRQ